MRLATRAESQYASKKCLLPSRLGEGGNRERQAACCAEEVDTEHVCIIYYAQYLIQSLLAEEELKRSLGRRRTVACTSLLSILDWRLPVF